MKEIHTEIEINAPGESVWRALTDFAAYPEWNPFIRRVEGERFVRALSLENAGWRYSARLQRDQPGAEACGIGSLNDEAGVLSELRCQR
jgi:Polyketide cyclase / dehydrase and lipid transport